VHHRQRVNRKALAKLGGDFAHFGQRHRFVGFVVEVERFAPAPFQRRRLALFLPYRTLAAGTGTAGVIAHNPFENNYGAVRRSFDLRG
jgi:hypothetical protein